MVLMMLNQRWMFKKTKIQKPKENLYILKELAVESVNQRLFLELRHFDLFGIL